MPFLESDNRKYETHDLVVEVPKGHDPVCSITHAIRGQLNLYATPSREGENKFRIWDVPGDKVDDVRSKLEDWGLKVVDSDDWNGEDEFDEAA